jgi:nucleotide-binding universal stress UspA family protein
VDFSDPSRVALDFAARLATQSGAALHVLHALDPLLSAAADAHEIDLTRESREELVRFTATIAAARGPLHHHVITGAVRRRSVTSRSASGPT